MATEFDSGSGGGSKRQRTDDEGEQAAADVEVAEEDRISTLPEALRLDILSLLPLKSAIRTGALSTQWRALWTRRWPAPSSLEFRFPAQDSPQQLMETLERRGRRRLDRLSLSFQMGELKAEGFRHLLAYAAACAVADIDVHLTNANEVSGRFFKFRLPPGNPHLERLSLSGNRIKLYDSSRSDSRPYSVLEAIHLHRVTVSDDTIFDLVAACPLLRTLDLRYCKGLRSGNLPAGSNLKSVTVAECESVADVSINNNSGLRSFRYSGGYLHADQIPTTIDDLYLCFGGPARRNCSGTTSWTEAYDGEWRLCKLRRSCLDALIDVSNLTVLTLCSSALRRVSGKARAKSLAGNAALCKLRNLREVQLMMFALYDENLDDIMDFLIICCSSRLERLFVQLPTRSDQYKPDEEPSETEDDGSEDVLSEEDEEEERRSWGYKSENEELEQELSEEEESDEDQSEEVELEEMELGENHSKEDESEEQGSPEGQSKEDGSKKELSDGGQSAEEPLGDGCENLMLLKMENFKGHHNEMRLVSFVLKKSARLNQLILFTPSDHPDGLHKDHLNTSEFLETKLLPVEKASPNAQIILSEPDDTAVQPLHWETFVEV